MTNRCASCLKADANLTACKACNLMKCCEDDCQMVHRSASKEDCWKNARDLFYQKLYAQPPRKEECPICMIPRPCSEDESFYMHCCGKTLCQGCRYCLTRERFPFCNTPSAKSNKEFIERLTDRMEKYNDPEAMMMLSDYYRNGEHGLPVDQSKAFELYKRASELECAGAHFHLGIIYQIGEGTEIDMSMAVYHYQIAAMMGHTSARTNLGFVEFEHGYVQRAMRHFMIAAKCGDDDALHNVKEGFKDGHVTKEDFAKALRAYQASCDETKSEQRDRAAVIIARRACISHESFS